MIPLNNFFHKQTLQFGSEHADFYCIDASPRESAGRASSILILDTNDTGSFAGSFLIPPFLNKKNSQNGRKVC